MSQQIPVNVVIKAEKLENITQHLNFTNIPNPISQGLDEIYKFANKLDLKLVKYVESFESYRKQTREYLEKFNLKLNTNSEQLQGFIGTVQERLNNLEVGFKDFKSVAETRLQLNSDKLETGLKKINNLVKNQKSEVDQLFQENMTEFRESIEKLKFIQTNQEEQLQQLSRGKLNRGQLKDDLQEFLKEDQQLCDLMIERLKINEVNQGIIQVNKKFEGRCSALNQQIENLLRQLKGQETKATEFSIKIDNSFQIMKESEESIKKCRRDINVNQQNIDILMGKNNEKYLKEIMGKLEVLRVEVEENEKRQKENVENLEESNQKQFEKVLCELEAHQNEIKQFEQSRNNILKQIDSIEEQSLDVKCRIDQINNKVVKQEDESKDMKDYFKKWKKSQINNGEKYEEFQEQKEYIKVNRDTHYRKFLKEEKSVQKIKKPKKEKNQEKTVSSESDSESQKNSDSSQSRNSSNENKQNSKKLENGLDTLSKFYQKQKNQQVLNLKNSQSGQPKIPKTNQKIINQQLHTFQNFSNLPANRENQFKLSSLNFTTDADKSLPYLKTEENNRNITPKTAARNSRIYTKQEKTSSTQNSSFIFLNDQNKQQPLNKNYSNFNNQNNNITPQNHKNQMALTQSNFQNSQTQQENSTFVPYNNQNLKPNIDPKNQSNLEFLINLSKETLKQQIPYKINTVTPKGINQKNTNQNKN